MRCHGRSAIAVKDQLFGWNFLFFNGCLNQLPGQIGAFAMSQHPADDATTVDVEDHVKVVIGPFFRAFQLGDVPRPDFIGAGRKQLRLLVIGMSQLITPFARALVIGENAIHRPHAAQVITFIKQLRVDLPWCLICETFAVKLIKHPLSFFD